LLISAGAGTALAAALTPSTGIAFAGGLGLLVTLWLATRRRRHAGGRERSQQMARTEEPLVCRLPVADRAQRTADFRGLFADALVGEDDVIIWQLTGPAAASRTLDALSNYPR
jgi:hypothetical protein